MDSYACALIFCSLGNAAVKFCKSGGEMAEKFGISPPKFSLFVTLKGRMHQVAGSLAVKNLEKC
jgi:hypothetical protein